MSHEKPASKTSEQFALQYTNHYHPDGKVVTLGNWDTWFDTTDTIRDLKQQGFSPTLLRREITITYSEWDAFTPVGGDAA